MNINNRFISRVAKLAGAPQSKAAGIDLIASIPSIVAKSQPLFTIHSETEGELNYALDFIKQGHHIFQIEENE